MINIQIVNDSNNELPKYATPESSGMDLMADFSKGVNEKFLFNSKYETNLLLSNPPIPNNVLTIYPGGRALVPTNIKTSFSPDYEMQIRSRSGLALKNGIFVTNGIGTIDADYRNYYGVILTNLGTEPFEIKQGDRIAQAVLMKVEKVNWNVVEELTDSERGLGGFGSTGK